MCYKQIPAFHNLLNVLCKPECAPVLLTNQCSFAGKYCSKNYFGDALGFFIDLTFFYRSYVVILIGQLPQSTSDANDMGTCLTSSPLAVNFVNDVKLSLMQSSNFATKQGPLSV